MAVERMEQNRDITLAPDTYLYLQNVGKGGLITVHRGPTAVTQTGQDEPVRYDPNTHGFKRCRLEEAVCQFQRANEGDYVILENPADDNSFPSNNSQVSKDLKRGRRIVIPGPWSEALWPAQSATVIEGHRLRTNQYLIATIYNADEAERNWDKTVVKPAADGEEKTAQRGLPRPESFAVGSRIVIRGTDVSFYIPCTGVEVQKDENGSYVREAVTLEQLEYAILIDENGKKEYPRGPAVVFPKPTQVFDKDSKGLRKFRPLELNNINGVHLKVTASFTGPDIENDTSKSRDFEEGEELFVTGKTLSIYYPREELAIIEYGEGNKKHYSTAIPAGEGRYVINRETGQVKLVNGPKMLLTDPRYEIPVRRILSDDECSLWYPGNQAALDYNRELNAAMAENPSGRSGVVSEGDWRKRQAKHLAASSGLDAQAAYLAAAGGVSQQESYQNFRREQVSQESTNANVINRGTVYTPPRTLTLNTKFDGVPRIEVWPGYAVLIVGADGTRRVEQGPKVVLLEYHEKLGFMSLSTGKPKTTDKLMRTAYLGTLNNQVGDIIAFESADHVKGKVKISLRVNFEGDTQDDKLKWFGVDNYVKLLCDHIRSIVAGIAKRRKIGEFKSDYINLVRDSILGVRGEKDTKRPGLFFSVNNMRVVEVEVLDLTLDDANISKLLDQAQHEAVKSSIELEQLSRQLEAAKEKERIEQEKAQATAATTKLKNTLQQEIIQSQIELLLAQVDSELKKLENAKKTADAQESVNDLTHQRKLARDKADADQRQSIANATWSLKKEEIDVNTAAAVKRFEAAKDGLHEVLVMMGREDMAARLAESCNIERFLTGETVGSSIANLLSVSPLLKSFFDQATAAGETYGKKRLARMFPEAQPSIPAATVK